MDTPHSYGYDPSHEAPSGSWDQGLSVVANQRFRQRLRPKSVALAERAPNA